MEAMLALATSHFPDWKLQNCMQVLAAAGKHQVLIFVHSRKETAKTAKFLKEEALREDKLAKFMGVSPSIPPPPMHP